MTNREIDITDFLDNVKVKFDTCNAIGYMFTCYDRNGEQKNLFRNTSTTGNKEERANEIIDTLRTYLAQHSEIAKIHGEYGGLRHNTKTIGDYFFRSNEDETTEQLRSQLEEAHKRLNGLEEEKQRLSESMQQVREQNDNDKMVNIMQTNYQQMTEETLGLVAQALGINCGNGLFGTDGKMSSKGMGVVLQIQQQKMKDDLDRNMNLQKIDNQNKEIADLKAQIELMRKEYERMENEVEDLREYQRETEPQLVELEKLKTKSGMIGAGIGQALSGLVAGLAQKSPLGRQLLGLDDEQETQQPQQYTQTQQNDSSFNNVRAVEMDD